MKKVPRNIPMSLSERIRPNSEAAPWVVEAVRALEAENALLREALRRISRAGVDGLDHARDVLVLERAIRLAQNTLMAAGPGKETTHES